MESTPSAFDRAEFEQGKTEQNGTVPLHDDSFNPLVIFVLVDILPHHAVLLSDEANNNISIRSCCRLGLKGTSNTVAFASTWRQN